MNILDIYKKYQIPPNLQLHMLRVAALGNYMLDHWKTPNQLDRGLITQTLLLHDMGNIIKFDLDSTLGMLKGNINHWRTIQKQFIKRYGHDEHLATNIIINEIKRGQKITNILDQIGASNFHLVIKYKDWEDKVCAYSDARIIPNGISTIKKRFEDVINRYSYRRPPEFIEKVKISLKFALDLEQQIQSQVTIDLQKITDKDIKPYIENLKNYSITAN